MPARFLEARWENLCLFTYAVPPAVLQPYLPEGLELDTIGADAFVSLVAFDFLDTSVFGVKWPGFVNFPEINLRFYVRRGAEERGVVFIRELVPQFFVAAMARLTYNEPYLSCPMKSKIVRNDNRIEVEHNLKFSGKDYSIKLSADSSSFLPDETSTEHFFKEHKWGYGKSHTGRTIRYEVNHPFWDVHPVLSHSLELDFGVVYGSNFAFLNKAQLHSIIFARGSEVAVFPNAVM